MNTLLIPSPGISPNIPTYRKQIKPSGQRTPASALWPCPCSPFLRHAICFFYPKLWGSAWDLHPEEQWAVAAPPGLTPWSCLQGPFLCHTVPSCNKLTLTFTWIHVLNFSCRNQEPGGRLTCTHIRVRLFRCRASPQHWSSPVIVGGLWYGLNGNEV